MTLQLPTEMYQIITPKGDLIGKLPDLSSEKLLELYQWMVFGRIFSDSMVALKRQGRVRTAIPFLGQEATAVGIGSSLQKDDWLIGSYREALALFAKGVSPSVVMRRYFKLVEDGYCPELCCLPLQPVISAHIPHAVGIAMGIKYDKKSQVVVGVCGDGATSEGDFNESLNFAGVFQVPMIFVVQNNGWAISTPRHRQTNAEYIAHRGIGFGIPSYIVDGNDVLAVYKVLSECVSQARAGKGPSLIELITYRMGPHTVSDNPRRYRSKAEEEAWQQKDPLSRFRRFLLNNAIITPSEEKVMHKTAASNFEQFVEDLESLPMPNPLHAFDMVYDTPTPQLEQQQTTLQESLEKES